MVQLRLCLRDGSELVLSLRQVSNVSSPMRLVPLSLEGITPMFKPEEFDEIVKHPTMADIDILIGLDYYYDIVGPEVWRYSSSIVVKETVIVKILAGFLKNGSTTGTTHHQMLVTSAKVSDEDELAFKRFLGIDEVAVVDCKERTDDEITVEQFNATVRFTGNRHEVQWLFKENPPNLPLNYDVAFRKLVSVHRILQSSPELLTKYDNIFRDQLEKGVIEVAPKDPEGLIHFLPHHAVVTHLKETTKVRAVFDASSKLSAQFSSLNESMFRGPVFLNDLCGLLLRFRMSKLAVVSDVEKAFLQIALQKEHRDCTRFLWLQDPRKSLCPENMIVYRYARVLFEAKASPFLLAAIIFHQIKLADTKVSREIMKSTHVDNVIGGKDTTMGLQQYHREAKQLFQSMSMNLREWYSNAEQFLGSIPESGRGKSNTPSVLGLKWNIENDTLAGSVGAVSHQCVTKRDALKSIASVYDPCGWYTAVTVSEKIIMQELWKKGIQLDEDIPDECQKQWDCLSVSLDQLNAYSLPCRFPCQGMDLEMT